MKKTISAILGIVIVLAIGLYAYNSNTTEEQSSILFSNGNQITTKVRSNSIVDLTNNVRLTQYGVRIYLKDPKSDLKYRMKINEFANVGKLRNYILDWYNDGNQIDSYKSNVNFVIPTQKEQEELYSFDLNQLDQEMFLNKYGLENIMISVGVKNISASNSECVKANIIVNNVPAYGFTIFNNRMLVHGDKNFYYGFVTADGVVIPAYELKQYAKEGQVKVISTGQEIDFNGANNGQDACLV